MRIILSFILFAICYFTSSAKVLHVLAIGNSFSQDAIEQNLYELALAYGDTLIIGNAYIPGCSIDRHYDNILNAKPEYSYRKIVNGQKITTDNVDLKTIIGDEQWDVISLQQASHFSGQKGTYANLSALKDEVIKLMPNKNAELIWHMTWAYAKDSDHSGFKNYGNSQAAMNDSIYAAVCTALPVVEIDRVIPAGPAIQNAREVFGDILNSDGYHLSHDLGRYVAACTWCEFLTGKSVVGNPYHPATLSDADARDAQLSAHKATTNFSIK